MQTASSLPEVCTFPIAKNRSPIAGRMKLILNSAVITSQPGGALVNAAYPQALSTMLVMAPA
ncbi:hypothetical protein CFU_1364 [Collimonas fungivorans Ter331]|uniref:Uncharacterized protein n=1 Tax=Collimonas fungivorans (strain Ter331) TaxID=1005048 RepID=G0AB71_COLFT|nr:hypothetical protein CFU_1364 [Collimonas fungivorans Ter331]